MGLGGISGMGVNVDDIYAAMGGSQPIVTTKQVFRFSPAAAYKINDALTLGASLNVVNQSLSMSFVGGGGTQVNLPQNQQFGFGATLGATYKINPKLQAGFTYTSKTAVSDMEYNNPDRNDQLRHGHARLGCLGPGVQAHAGSAGGSRHQAHFLQ